MRWMRRALLAVLPCAVLGACASGGSPLQQGGDGGPEIDAAPHPDSDDQPHDGPPDAFVPDAFVPDAFVPDAFVPDAFVPDAFVPPDACVPVVTQLLVNPTYDLTPMGAGWQQTPIDAQFPLITDQDGVPEHSAPFKAWLGGLVASSGTVTDVLFQDVAIPPLTTQLVLTGVFDVRTSEDPSATFPFDTASLTVTQTNGTPIVTILSLSNLTPKTDWTPISFTFAQNLSAQTVRLRMTSSNDFSLPTSFFFDTFALTATHGCP
jgi:hypothetical protein